MLADLEESPRKQEFVLKKKRRSTIIFNGYIYFYFMGRRIKTRPNLAPKKW